MTITDKEKIQHLRAEGLGYKAIASRLSLTADAVKGFCKRSGLDNTAAQNKAGACRQCGKSIESKTGTGRKKFCSDQCRYTWWNGHAYLHKQKDENKQTCAHCGCEFYSFRSQRRKYCGHSCYVAERFMEVRVHDAGTV